MDKQFKNKLIEALLSKKYKQGRRALRNNDEYCCLGVACDLIDPSGWDEKDSFWKVPNTEKLKYNMTYSGSKIPSLAADKLGIDDWSMFQLLTMNDSGYSFEQIAEWIKVNL